MANFENGFYEAHAVKVNEQKLSEKFHVDYTPEGSTPDGYKVHESLTIETGRGAVDISRDGSAVYKNGGNETENSMTEAYTMMGIDTGSKEFKQFQKDIQKPENYNAQTVEKMLETVPQLTAEKQIEKLNNFSYENEREQAEFKHNFVNSEIVKNLTNEVENKGFTKEQIHELAGDTWENQIGLSDDELEQSFVEKVNENLIEKGYEPIEIVSEINKELSEKGHNKIELAEPGRQYTGEITAIDEEKTTQITKSGTTIIHETKNIPGIERQEVGQNVKIDYSNGKEAKIEDKSSGLERNKENKVERQAEKSNEIDLDVPF